jgi:UDP-N-acetylmuramoyl-L-alanyl-D-glutamate--2,6-diaminopimelate ligase
MFSDGKKQWLNDKKMTMVGRFFTQKMLAAMLKNGCQFAIVETTSEGIRQYRHRFINYDTVVFTGLYPEHIESHGSFEKYKEAKGQLFKHLKACRHKYVNHDKLVCHPHSELKKIDYQLVKKTIIANLDNEHVSYFLDFWAETKIGYSRNSSSLAALNEASLGAFKNVELLLYGQEIFTASGSEFEVIIPASLLSPSDRQGLLKEAPEADDCALKISWALLGSFNIENAVAATALALSQELRLSQIKSGLEKVKSLPGRLEKIEAGQDFMVVVDYAFEPKAMAKLYETVTPLKQEGSKIIQVLGSAGGGRDRGRRKILGEIAGRLADYIIVTNEDPYDEDPKLIIEEVALGAELLGRKLNSELFKISDRRQAIRKALSLASQGDIVLITGKGSEQAICVKDGHKLPWDDRKVAKEELALICG